MIDKKLAAETDRRAFLKGAGKYAVIVPPTMTFLLSTTLVSEAVASSSSCNRGLGNGAEGCDPGNSSGKPGAAGEHNESWKRYNKNRWNNWNAGHERSGKKTNAKAGSGKGPGVSGGAGGRKGASSGKRNDSGQHNKGRG